MSDYALALIASGVAVIMAGVALGLVMSQSYFLTNRIEDLRDDLEYPGHMDPDKLGDLKIGDLFVMDRHVHTYQVLGHSPHTVVVAPFNTYYTPNLHMSSRKRVRKVEA